MNTVIWKVLITEYDNENFGFQNALNFFLTRCGTINELANMFTCIYSYFSRELIFFKASNSFIEAHKTNMLTFIHF